MLKPVRNDQYFDLTENVQFGDRVLSAGRYRRTKMKGGVRWFIQKGDRLEEVRQRDQQKLEEIYNDGIT